MSLKMLLGMKSKLKVLVLGAYRPRLALNKLELLRDCLVRRRFESTKLVKNFTDTTRYDEDYDIHFTKKSRVLMESWANVIIFVFFRIGENLGVGNELAYACLELPTKLATSVAFFETNLNVGSQIRGTVKISAQAQKLSFEDFQNDLELCNLAFGHCRKALDHLFYYLE